MRMHVHGQMEILIVHHTHLTLLEKMFGKLKRWMQVAEEDFDGFKSTSWFTTIVQI